MRDDCTTAFPMYEAFSSSCIRLLGLRKYTATVPTPAFVEYRVIHLKVCDVLKVLLLQRLRLCYLCV